MKKSLLVLISLFLLSSSFAYSLNGTVFNWDTLERTRAVVKVYSNNSLVNQVITNESGDFSLNLKEGTYDLKIVSGNLSYETEVKLENDLEIEAPLLPSEEGIFLNTSVGEYENIGTPQDVAEDQEEKKESESPFKIFVTLAIALIVLFFFLRKKKPEIKGDKQLVLDQIKEEGGRVKQGVLKEKTGFSASKLSLLTKELEEEGSISKEKMGREKVIELT